MLKDTDHKNHAQVEFPEVVIRLRMSGHDGHYAGGLVDGARMLQLFGDVATELLIRYDGDEGLFRAYESVEFLAPVFSGDYIEATGKITRVGKTSRTMEFEARKVIQALPPNKGGIAVSSAEVLAEPTPVCRARGTCVTPTHLQRFSRSESTQVLPSRR
jgi:acyl-coenzyme A thioesterase PaaI-like protein